MLMFPIAAVVCALSCVLVHYEFLRLLSCSAPKLPIPPRQRILYVVAGALGSHIVQVGLFALMLWAVSYVARMQTFNIGHDASLEQALYISSESYAALGSSETFSYGPLRLFAGVEGLTGLLVIGWTSAFTYWCMTKYWDEHPKRPSRKPRGRHPRREAPLPGELEVAAMPPATLPKTLGENNGGHRL